MRHCNFCGRFIGGRSIKRYCDGACRAGASRERRGAQADGETTHGHRLTVLGLAEDGWTWRYGCKDCPAEWRGPISVEALEAVDCGKSERRVA